MRARLLLGLVGVALNVLLWAVVPFALVVHLGGRSMKESLEFVLLFEWAMLSVAVGWVFGPGAVPLLVGIAACVVLNVLVRAYMNLLRLLHEIRDELRLLNRSKDQSERRTEPAA